MQERGGQEQATCGKHALEASGSGEVQAQHLLLLPQQPQGPCVATNVTCNARTARNAPAVLPAKAEAPAHQSTDLHEQRDGGAALGQGLAQGSGMALDEHAAGGSQQGHAKAGCHQLEHLADVALGGRWRQVAAAGCEVLSGIA